MGSSAVWYVTRAKLAVPSSSPPVSMASASTATASTAALAMAWASSGLPAVAVTVMMGAFGSRVAWIEPATAFGSSCRPVSSTIRSPTTRVENSGR